MIDDPQHGWLPVLMMVMAIASGMVDAVSLLTLGHVFVANMTGNLIFIGLSLGGASEFSVVTSLVALAAFVVGVLVSRSRLASPDAHRLRLLRNAGAAETLLFVVALVLSLTLGEHPAAGGRDSILVVCAVALGIQNGLIRRLAVPEISTTVATRTIVGLLWTNRPTDPVTIRQLTSVLCLLGGAVTGAALVEGSGRSAALIVIVVLTAAVATAAATTWRRALTWS
jgi:uncharacterized membrane protein YoaK (UPF0700 family)